MFNIDKYYSVTHVRFVLKKNSNATCFVGTLHRIHSSKDCSDCLRRTIAVIIKFVVTFSQTILLTYIHYQHQHFFKLFNHL